jgi:hypothetical protein
MEDSEGVDAAEEVGVDGSDILLHAVEVEGVFGTFQASGQKPCCAETRRTRWGCEKKNMQTHAVLMTQTNLSHNHGQDFRAVNSTQRPLPYFAFSFPVT